MKLKFFTLLKFFLKAKWHFFLPPKKKILIYDKANSDFLINFFKKENCEILNIRFEKINILILILSLFSFRNISLSRKYTLKYISHVNPSLIITFMDNRPNYYKLKKEFENKKIIAVQNGYRPEIFEVFKGVTKKENLLIDYLFVMDEMHKNLYENFISGHVVVSGSLKNNFVPIKKKDVITKKIIFLSQYRDPEFFKGIDIWGKQMSFEKHFKAEIDLIPYLVDYCEKNKFELEISGSTSTIKERYFYEKLIKKNIKWSFYSKKSVENDLTVYEKLDQATAAVFIDSTLGYESLARLKPTAAFSIRGNIHKNAKYHNFGFPEKFSDEGPFWSNNLNKKIFKQILDLVTNVSEKEWKKIYNEYATKISAYDEGNIKFKKIINLMNVQ